MNAVIYLNDFLNKNVNKPRRALLTQPIRFGFLFVYLLLLFACDNSKQAHAPRTDESQADAGDIWFGTKYEQTDVKIELKRVSEHVYYVEGPPGAPTDNDGFMSNASVVIGDEEVVVFDSLGTPSLAYLLHSKIKQLTTKPIRRVVTSHYHADHVYGLQVFKEQGAEVIAPLGARTYINSPAAEGRLKERRESLFPWVNESTYIVKPDKFIEKEEVIDIGTVQLKIVPLGSTHSDGDLIVYVEPDHVLLVGDLMFEGRIPFIAGSKPGRWLKFLNELDPSKFKIVVPGHGTASNDPKNAVNFTRGYLNFLHTSMMKAVEELTPFDEAYDKIDWTEYKDRPAFQANRMNAYFVYLYLEDASVQ